MHWLNACWACCVACSIEAFFPKIPPPLLLGGGPPVGRFGQTLLTVDDAGACPAASTTLAELTQALGMLGACAMIWAGAPGLANPKPTLPWLKGRLTVAGLM